MNKWRSTKPSDAPLGAVSLIPIMLTAILFPLIRLLGEKGVPVSMVLTLICYLSFSPAVLLTVYSLAAEKSKLFGAAGLVLAVILLWVQRLTLYFIIPMSLYLPLGIFLLVVFLALRIWHKRQNRQNYTTSPPPPTPL